VPRAETYTVAEVAARYRVRIATVATWIRAGELKAVNVSRSARSKKPRFRISNEALAAFEAARTPTAAPVQKRARRPKRGGVVEFYK
jgi:transposase